VLSPEIIAGVRRRYADGALVSQILAEYELSIAQLYCCLDGGPPGPDRLPPLPRRRLLPRRAREPGAARQALVARLWRSAGKQVHEVEQRLARADLPPPERERDMRMMAVLVKTLRELTTLDQAQRDEAANKDAPDDDDDDAVPRDLDELRRELARRVDLIRQGRRSS
jgi:hypothetical protein